MDLEAAADRIHTAIQSCLNDGLLPAGIVTAWHLAASAINIDGEEQPILLTDNTSSLTQTLGLIELARICSTDAIAPAWDDD